VAYFEEDDIPGLLEDAGEDITLGANTTQGCVDIADQRILPGELVHLVGKVIAVWIKTGSLPGVMVGALLTLRGASYKIRERTQEGDGALTRLLCLEQ
jgi:hypothetical protein